MKIDKEQWKWTREPREFSISEDKIEIITNPHTVHGSEHIIILEMIMPLFCR